MLFENQLTFLSTASSGNTVAVKVSDLPTSNEALSLLIMTLVTWTMLGVTVIVVSPTTTAVTFPSSTLATVSSSIALLQFVETTALWQLKLFPN